MSWTESLIEKRPSNSRILLMVTSLDTQFSPVAFRNRGVHKWHTSGYACPGKQILTCLIGLKGSSMTNRLFRQVRHASGVSFETKWHTCQLEQSNANLTFVLKYSPIHAHFTKRGLQIKEVYSFRYEESTTVPACRFSIRGVLQTLCQGEHNYSKYPNTYMR